MTDKIKTWWEQYSVQIITVLFFAIGFYFLTNFRMEGAEAINKNHETRIESLELEQARTTILLQTIMQKTEKMDNKLDKLLERK